ncbi:MAG: HAD family hydrolase [Candidatus Hodarchaeales archaeon]|jgi:HAD superfamily hydrolase (TIGR01509 family)
MSDNTRKGEQWKDLIVRYFVPRYGGIADEWGEANHRAVKLLMEKIEELINKKSDLEFKKYQSYEDETWINVMFDSLGIEKPPKNKYSKIYREVEEWITPQIKANIKGIIEIIKQLNSEGYTLHTASGETSWVLKNYLAGMGILDCFTKLYGPDLVGMMKGGAEYYRRIFSHAQVPPSSVIVIDDNPKLLQLVEQQGAYTIQSCVLKKTKPDKRPYYTDPSELPRIIKSITS